nr:lon protease homolog 2, peroxisomal isoform X2 [Ipomoea batatas]
MVEQELWQKENKGVIGILLVQDSAETSTVDPALSPECTLKNQASISDLTNMMEKVCSKFTGISGELLLEPCISQEEWRNQVGEFRVQEISTRGTYYTARITSLELTKAGKASVQYITKSGWICKEHVIVKMIF